MAPRKQKKTQAQLAFGGWLKAKRDEFGITAAEAAKHAGVDATTWRAIEAPGMPWHTPNTKTVRGIAETFGVPVEEVAARAGVALPSVGDYQIHAASAMPQEAMDLILRLTDQLAEAQRLHAEALARLTELTGGGERPVRRRRSPSRPQQ